MSIILKVAASSTLHLIIRIMKLLNYMTFPRFLKVTDFSDMKNINPHHSCGHVDLISLYTAVPSTQI